MTRWRSLLAAGGLAVVALGLLLRPESVESSAEAISGMSRYREGRARWGREGPRATAVTPGCHSCLTGLVAYYSLTANSTDETGHGHDGTDTLITYGADGATFGATSSITVGAINLQSGGAAWSAAVLIKPTNTTIRQQIMGNAGASQQLWGISDQFGLLKTRYENNLTSINGLTTLGVGASVHLLFTYSAGGTWSWYVNGVLDSTGSDAFVTATSFSDIGFSTNFGRHYVGSMEFLALWSRELSSVEATGLAVVPDLTP